MKNKLWFVPIGLAFLVTLIAILLQGSNIVLLNPRGYIAGEQYRLMLRTVATLFAIAIPTLYLFYTTAWKYREKNTKPVNDAPAMRNKQLVFWIWAIPTGTMLLLGAVMWPATHELAPQKALDSNLKPLVIKVVAMRWKWLFVYPDQNIATINSIHIPLNVPVQFDITADETPMSSFWIPQLGGQLYAMTGHVNRLNLIADVAGDYSGSSAEINGEGFAGMKFNTHAETQEDFNQWIQEVKTSQDVLDTASYQNLLVPSEYNQPKYYAQTYPEVYDIMLMKYAGMHGQHMEHK
jgi:cytochrome o ubiquinol oxidase subunit II